MPNFLPILSKPWPSALNSSIRASTEGLTRRLPSFVPLAPWREQAHVDPLSDDAPLELSEHSQHLKHGFARGRRRVETLLMGEKDLRLFHGGLGGC